MSRHLLGVGATGGWGSGTARWVTWNLPPVPHRTIAKEEVDAELRRFEEARTWAIERIAALRDRTRETVGAFEAKVFEPQILMLQDPDVVGGTVSYIGDNFLSAERAFDLTLLEIRSQFVDRAHAMVVDRIADIRDVRYRVLARLTGRVEDPLDLPEEDAVLLFDELTPSAAVRLDRTRVKGIITVGGTRSSHSAVLLRSSGIPMVVGVGGALRDIKDGTRLLLDGATGRIVVDPTRSEVEAEARRSGLLGDWNRLEEHPAGPVSTRDGVLVRLQANLDQPDETEAAVRVGAEGVGLFRSEFLLLGRRVIPSEDEQYLAYRAVVEAFPEHDVTLRTFDVGGDKLPIFLNMPLEENPYLGWRAIRVCLDVPDLFRNQLRAAVRASRHGNMRILLPFIVSVEEVRRSRELLAEVIGELRGSDSRERDIPVGIMVETPSTVETLELFAPEVDFLSLGTNDLTQYVMAADRGSARVAALHDPLQPALVRMYSRLRKEADRLGLPISVCGELPAEPVGLCALLALGYREFSLSPAYLSGAREVVRAVSVEELSGIFERTAGFDSATKIRAPIAEYLHDALAEGTVASIPVPG
ncbi:MAG: phosphoenolpyruvate--protein phosphotransferase [Gemmatimonadota bacterium]